MSVTLMGENFNPIRRTIKNNRIFLVTDQDGNIIGGNTSGFGLYTDDTRFLSRLELKINNTKPVILSSSSEAGHSSVIIGTNISMSDYADSTKYILQETVQVKRESIIYGDYFETITIANYNLFEVGLKLELFFDADFLDIFEVRNISLIEKDIQKKIIYEGNNLKFVYQDITGATLTTEIVFIEEKPVNIENGNVIFEFSLDTSAKKEIKYHINLRSTASLPEKLSAYDFNEAFEKAVIDDKNWLKSSARFFSSNEDFNEMAARGSKDINMLRINAHYGEYIAAGIPWFTTLFGRDSLISARQCLLLNQNIAKNTLETLAKFQGKEDNPWRDEEPGKILHELRFGELARSNKIPHSPYYGTVDATPLWIILLHDYFKWTNDKETLEKLWQNALDCLMWMDNYAMINNGYAAYIKRSPEGLDNQGWKDSWNSNIHNNGHYAEPPIALVEVQGYFYAAKIKLAELAGYMGEYDLKLKLLKETQEFKEKFQRDFWMEDLQFYAMGLDKYGKQMKVISSNPGHCIETGIIDDYYANIVAEKFFTMNMYSGWGIRTLSNEIISYNPMSYHNGTIWPHDNSIIAFGLAKIGRVDLAIRATTSLFEAARLVRYKRLPELFCGFSRVYSRQDPPVSYPVACTPQAWAASSVFLMIQAMLNIVPDAQNQELKIYNPLIPMWLDYLRIENIKVGSASVDLEFRKTQKSLVIDVFDKRGKLDIIIKK
ncbi:MAG: glycogen debranching N-terminal domain-containing protein [Candidatus Gastranaerophilales bacterium]|nr:glycogen debranching N-terminal domain-containing protein [Candidatus Gastranaerophilales bacterium]